MSTQVQLRRGTAAENDAFTGAVGEVTVDTTSDTLRVHDGSTAGGTALAVGAGTVTAHNLVAFADTTGNVLEDAGPPIPSTITSPAQGDSIEYASGTSEFVNKASGWAKSISVESPGAAEDLSVFFTQEAITITKMVCVLVGSSTPSVTWTLRHSTDRSAAGNEVVTSGTTTTSITSGSTVTSFNDATIPANSFVWLETTAQSGTVTSLHLTAFYTRD